MNDVPQSVYDRAFEYVPHDGTGKPLQELLYTFGDPLSDDLAFERIMTLSLNVIYVLSGYWKNLCGDDYVGQSTSTLAIWLKSQPRRELPNYYPHERLTIRNGKYFNDCYTPALMAMASCVRCIETFSRSRNLGDCLEFMDWAFNAYAEGCYNHQYGEPNFAKWIVNALLQPSWNRCLIFDPHEARG